MTHHIDPTMVDVWKAVTTLHSHDDYSRLDQKTRAIIFAVAEAEMQQKPINYKGILSALKQKSQMPIIARIHQLTREGWLKVQVAPTDKRAKTLHLTPKSVTFVNSLSSAIKSVVKGTSAIAAMLIAELRFQDNSTTFLLASAFTSI